MYVKRYRSSRAFATRAPYTERLDDHPLHHLQFHEISCVAEKTFTRGLYKLSLIHMRV